MPTFPVVNVGEFGVVKDRPASSIPFNAWSDGRNVRARDGVMEKMRGESTVFGTPTVAPYNALFTSNATSNFWLYAGLAKVYAYDFATHTDVTRIAGDYNANADLNWTMSNFQGIPILNNGVDVPQQWAPVDTATKLIALANWDATWIAGSVRPFKQFLVALDITKSGTRYPRMVKWSHGAAAGAVPSSWDETDTTIDAGEYELADSFGFCLDGVTLRDVFIVYKQDSVWGMQYVGGDKVMRFFKIFDELGALAKRCAVEFFSGKHAVFGNGDVYVHDGQNKQSIVDSRVRKWWFEQLNPNYTQRSFVVANRVNSEVWFCAATGAATLPNLALVWNWTTQTITFRELSEVAGAAIGIVGGTAPDVWDNDSDTWDSDTSVWDDVSYGLLKQEMLLARPSAANLLLTEVTNQLEGANMTAYIERTGIGIPFRANQPPDTSSVKFLTAVWPRIEGTAGGVVRVYVGGQMNENDAPTYLSPYSYVIGTTRQIPVRCTGRLFALKFESDSDIEWNLASYDVDVKQLGRF